MKRREVLKTAGLILGYTMTAGTAAAVLGGCSADATPDWTPAFIDKKDIKVLKSIADAIIPGTDKLPGAKDIMIEKFFDERLSLYGKEDEKTKYMDGLAALIEKVQTDSSKSIEKLSQEECLTLVRSELDGNSQFMKSLYEMTVVGFCTSERGAKEVLVFNPIPGEQKGSVPVEEVGGIWYI